MLRQYDYRVREVLFRLNPEWQLQNVRTLPSLYHANRGHRHKPNNSDHPNNQTSVVLLRQSPKSLRSIGLNNISSCHASSKHQHNPY